MARAKEAFVSLDFDVLVLPTLEDALNFWEAFESEEIAGVVTDLHFPEKGVGSAPELDASKPCGLAIVAKAVRQGLPVVVCSDVNHHHANYLKIAIGALEEIHPLGRIPFIMDAKDWKAAACELVLMAQRRVVLTIQDQKGAAR